MTPPSTIPFRAPAATVRAVPWPADLCGAFLRLAALRQAQGGPERGRGAAEPGCVWLDSAGGPRRLTRWSVLACRPSAVLSSEGGRTRLVARDGRTLMERARKPFEALREALQASPPAADANAAVPFGPGLYGYLAYDLGPHVEPTAPLSPVRDIGLPDLWFGLYGTVLALDHEERRAFLVGDDAVARDRLEQALAQSSSAPRPAPLPAARKAEWNLTREEYLAAVGRAREYIAAGDIFQVNLSRRLTVTFKPGPGGAVQAPDLYLRLREANPAPYAAYVGLGEGRAVLSSSPELFLDLAGGRIVTRPIKGTRPLRPGEDDFNHRMRAELEASEKDRAELVMIIDLERNDLGRVATYGSVRVTEPRTVEAYAAVHHTVATVEGRLHPGRDLVDLLKATFPGGSITGAPKVRAMQIIAELEPTRRSVYTGAVGYLGPPSPGDPAGRCALNIAIRTAIAADGKVHVQVGGGIVADSEPEAEFDETADKARAMLAAVGLTE